VSTKSDMPKATLEEKRLENLRRQLSGKMVHPQESSEKSSNTKTFSFKASTSSSTTKADTAYLRGDLLKTFILSTLAVAAELSIYFLTKNHVLNLGSLLK